MLDQYGATFKLNAKPAACRFDFWIFPNQQTSIKPCKVINFSHSLGLGGYAWNIIRSEADDLIFKHAKKCGAHTYDGTKINQVEFEPHEAKDLVADPKIPDPERAVSATWSRKDGSSGKISFDYVVDASGRAGVFSTKYLKNRTVNKGLRNIAHWTYWKSAATFGVRTEGESSPFFEALGGIYG